MRRRRAVSAVAAAVFVALALSACGGSSPAGSGTSSTSPSDKGRPLARLAAACRAAPSLGGRAGNADVRALVVRLWGRAELLTSVLGAQASGPQGWPLLAPLRHALAGMRKALRRASSAPPTPAVRRALQQAAGRLNAAVQQIGIPECAVAVG